MPLINVAVEKLRKDYLISFFEKINAIEKLSDRLVSGEASSCVQELVYVLHNAAGSAGMFGCFTISQLCRHYLKIVSNTDCSQSGNIRELSKAYIMRLREEVIAELGVNEEPVMEKSVKNESEVRKDNKDCRILVVEDDPVLAMLYTELLSERYPGFIMCHKASDALALLRGAPSDFDIIISDYHLRDLGGLSLVEALRVNGGQAKIILCTGDYSIDVKNLMAKGIDSIIFKPTPLPAVIEVIEKLRHK